SFRHRCSGRGVVPIRRCAPRLREDHTDAAPLVTGPPGPERWRATQWEVRTIFGNFNGADSANLVSASGRA
ncbi:MAG TPA: hypothetical protein PLK67_20785, partial [Bryobacteraceae bacterium]|nr:hypothetical protein [Bryobacteraceae bacterium]